MNNKAMTNSSTLHFTIKEDGKLYYLPEVPEEPKQVVVCGGTHACTCASLAFENGANRDVVDLYDDNCPHRYNSALQKAKDNAIEVGSDHNFIIERIKWRIYCDNEGFRQPKGFHEIIDTIEIQKETIYTLTGNYSVEMIEKFFCKMCGKHDTIKRACYQIAEGICGRKSKSVAFIKQQEVEQKEELRPTVSTFEGTILMMLFEFQKSHDEYQQNINDKTVNPNGENTDYFRGKSDAYGYAARQIKSALKWHGKLKD